MRLFVEDVAVSLVDDAFLFTTRARPEPLAVPAGVIQKLVIGTK